MKKKLTYEEQIKIFETLGYTFNEEVTKEMILDEVLEIEWECEGKEEAEQHIEDNPFSLLYSLFGWRSPEIEAYNYSEHSISFDLEFFDHILWYEWFMERMGAITNGEINFTDIKTFTDDEDYEWIEFKVNGIEKKWKLAKKGYIADTYVQRFSYLWTAMGNEFCYRRRTAKI